MDYRAKVSLIGNERTGKTSLILRYLKDTFTNEYITTLGADFIDKTYTHDDLDALEPGDEFIITTWDMAGQSHFKQIAEIYCEGSAGMIIVFDVNDKESFQSVSEWVEFARKVAPEAVLLIVGNKTDLQKEMSNEDIQRLEKKFGIPIYLTSAKVELDDDLSNVCNVFEDMAKKIFTNHLNEKIQNN